MKTYFLILLFGCMSFFGYSQTWHLIGPDTANISKVVFALGTQHHVLCADNGFYLYNFGTKSCEFFTYSGMAVTGAAYFNPEKILITMADGSYSDGIYAFDIYSHVFDPMDWIFNPNFLYHHHNDQTYWVGSDWGNMLRSEDGITWESVAQFNSFPCICMASQDNHMIVQIISDLTNGYWSDDNGQSWNPSEIGPLLSDLVYRENGQLLGVFPGYSNSSGLWRSDDFGNSWQIEFYQDNMTTVCLDVYSDVIVGFDGEGLARYNPESGLEFINGDLPALNINKIQVNNTMSAPALFVSTDQGFYYSYDYYVGVDDIDKTTRRVSINPNPSTDIIFIESVELIQNLKIINSTGTVVLHASPNSKSLEIDLTPLPTGIYFLKVTSQQISTTTKIIRN